MVGIKKKGVYIMCSRGYEFMELVRDRAIFTDLTEEELDEVAAIVRNEVATVRKTKSWKMRHSLKEGDRVKLTGKHARHGEGVITKVNVTRALVKFDAEPHKEYSVPFSIMEKVEAAA